MRGVTKIGTNYLSNAIINNNKVTVDGDIGQL
jgi:hypothetical protein